MTTSALLFTGSSSPCLFFLILFWHASHLGFLLQEVSEFSICDCRLVSDLLVISPHLLFELGNVFGIKELIGWCILEHNKTRSRWNQSISAYFYKKKKIPYLPQLGLTKRKGIHKGLSYDWQAAIQIFCLLHVKHKLRVFKDVDPEAQRQTVKTGYIELNTRTLNTFCALISLCRLFLVIPPHLYLLVFQMCSTSGSVIFRLSACVSRKSKKYLTAGGALEFVSPQMDLNRFSTYECTATWREKDARWCCPLNIMRT